MSPRDVVKEVCRRMGVEYRRLMRGCRWRSVSAARSVAAYVLRVRFRFSYPELTQFLGVADHTTVLWHVRRALKTAWMLDEARDYLAREMRLQLEGAL